MKSQIAILDVLLGISGVSPDPHVLLEPEAGNERTCNGLSCLGAALNPEASGQGADRISSPASRLPVAVERTNEEWVAAWHACRLLEVPGHTV